MFSYTTYALSTGQILSITQSSIPGGATSVSDPSLQGQVAGSFSALTTYIEPLAPGASGPPTVAARPAMALSISKTAVSANGTDTAVITGVPANGTLSIDAGTPEAQGPYSVTDGTITFSASVAGTYVLDISAFPALDATFNIVAS